MKCEFFILGLLSLFCNRAISQVGVNIFDDTYIHIIQINSLENITCEEFHDTLYTIYAPEQEARASDRTYFPSSVTIDRVKVDTIGLRYKGQSTFQGLPTDGKYSFKIDFNEFVKGQEFDGLKKLNLNNNRWDPTCMRNKLAMESMARMGIAAPRTSYAKVYVNGSYKGIYLIVEQIDKTFLKDRFSPDSTGLLYKAVDWGGGPLIPPTQLTLERSLLQKTGNDEGNYLPIIDVWNITNGATDLMFYDAVSKVYDFHNFIKQMAVQTFVGDRDHYCVGGANHYLYLNPLDNKLVMIPWDYDLSWNRYWNGKEYQNNLDPLNWVECIEHENSVYAAKMLSIPRITSKYHAALCEVLNYGFDSLWVEQRINTLTNLIGDEVVKDTLHFAQFTDFESQLDSNYLWENPLWSGETKIFPGMRSMIRGRYAQVRNALHDAGFNCPCNHPTLKE